MNFKELAKTLEVVHTATFNQKQVTGKPSSVGDIYAALPIMVNRGATSTQSQALAVVVSPLALKMLKYATTSALSGLDLSLEDFVAQGTYVGTLNGNIAVILDPDADGEVPLRTILFNKDGDLKVSEVFLENISITV